MKHAFEDVPGRVRPRLTVAGVACLFLSLWGCLAVYNATYHMASAYHFVGRQLVWVVVGCIVLLLTSGMSTAGYHRYWPFAAGMAYLALWAVLFFGIRINGMRGWFAFGGVFLQPSELAKPAFVLCLAALLERTRDKRRSWVRGYLPALALLVLWVLPILLEPDFGTLLVYGLTFVLLYWCMGGRLTHIMGSALAATPIAVFALKRHPYVLARFQAYLHPEAYAQTSGWHLLQFQRSLASGGLLGRSWGRGLWSQAYLPLGYSDSIFASTAEAVGFLGVLPLVLLVLCWVAYGYWRTGRADDSFKCAAILGMVSMLAGQAFIHLSVNLGLLPPTGITLPLISYGGSSLVASLAAVGIVEGLSQSAVAEE